MEEDKVSDSLGASAISRTSNETKCRFPRGLQSQFSISGRGAEKGWIGGKWIEYMLINVVKGDFNDQSEEIYSECHPSIKCEN